MKWFGRIALVLIGLLLAVDMLLPSGFKVQRSVEMAATPERIYPLIACGLSAHGRSEALILERAARRMVQ